MTGFQNPESRIEQEDKDAPTMRCLMKEVGTKHFAGRDVRTIGLATESHELETSVGICGYLSGNGTSRGGGSESLTEVGENRGTGELPTGS